MSGWHNSIITGGRERLEFTKTKFDGPLLTLRGREFGATRYRRKKQEKVEITHITKVQKEVGLGSGYQKEEGIGGQGQQGPC